MRKIFFFVLIGTLGLFAYMFISEQLQNQIQREEIENKRQAYLKNIPSVTITGILQYWKPIDGPSYAIIPEEEIDVNMDYNRIYLYGGKLNSSLHDKKVSVTGKLIENYVEYNNAIGMPVFGGDPNTAVIFVSDVEIIDDSESETK